MFELYFDRLNAAYFDKLNPAHPLGAYVLKDVFYWIEVKKQTEKLSASRHIVVSGKFVILSGILQAAKNGNFKCLAATKLRPLVVILSAENV
jgi:hypothetical protein